MWSRLEQSEAEAVREREEIQALCQKILEENELNLEPIDIQLQVDEEGFRNYFRDPCDCMEIKEDEILEAFPKVEEMIFLDKKDPAAGSSETIPVTQYIRPDPGLRRRPDRQDPKIVTVDITEDDDDEFKCGFKSALEVHQESINKRTTTDANPKSSATTPFRQPVNNDDGEDSKKGGANRIRNIGLSRSNVPSREPQKPSPSTESQEIEEKCKEIDEKLIDIIKSSIMVNTQNVTWDDISGLEYPKSIIQETIIMPQLRPDLFNGIRRPPKGILLFGPPGTGKTMIGKCIAAQSNSKFFSVSAANLQSKWIGEGEKLVKALFAVAEVYQPSVIFVDEIDSLLRARSDHENESSRRLKTEFLIRLDGAGTSDDDQVLIVGATNRPQDLDDAARRRLVKRLYIPLPDHNGRLDMFSRQLKKVKYDIPQAELERLATLTEGYSGADIKSLCNEAAMGPIRDIPKDQFANISADDVRPVRYGDFEYALKRTKASVDQKDLDAYVQWDKLFGCGSD